MTTYGLDAELEMLSSMYADDEIEIKSSRTIIMKSPSTNCSIIFTIASNYPHDPPDISFHRISQDRGSENL